MTDPRSRSQTLQSGKSFHFQKLSRSWYLLLQPFSVFMSLSLDSVSEGIMFLGCPVCPSVCSHCPIRYCYHDISWMAWTVLIKLTGYIHKPLLMTILDSRGQRLWSHCGSSNWWWRPVTMNLGHWSTTSGCLSGLVYCSLGCVDQKYWLLLINEFLV